MDALTFIVRIVEAIVWPVAVGLIFWALRGNIGGLIGKIRRFKWKDTEVDFSEELDRAEADLPVALPPPVESSPELRRSPPKRSCRQPTSSSKHGCASSVQSTRRPKIALNHRKQMPTGCASSVQSTRRSALHHRKRLPAGCSTTPVGC